MRGNSSKFIKFGLASPLLIFPLLVSAEIIQIGFTNEPQTLSPGEISGTFTIQLQDSSGSPAQAEETFDIQFVSTSETGEFLSPTTENPATKTLSTGSANKNFRYRDSVQGTHTLSVNARGRMSGLEVTGSQVVRVGSGSGAGSVSSGNSSLTSAAPSNTSSGKKSDSNATLDIGKDRVGSVGNPMEFKVESSFSSKKKTQFRWNFGDGSEEYGREIVHTYEYPGDYAVTLSVITSERKTAARINVKVIDPHLEIISANPQKVEVKNFSKQEIDLYGWALWASGKSFLFPQGTILKPNQTIAFSGKVTGLKPNYPSEAQLFLLGQTEGPKLNEKLEAVRQEKITALQARIWELQEIVASRKAPAQIVTSPATNTSATPEATSGATLVANSISLVPNGQGRGWFATLKRFLLGNKDQ